jgi:hypothetical protein
MSLFIESLHVQCAAYHHIDGLAVQVVAVRSECDGQALIGSQAGRDSVELAAVVVLHGVGQEGAPFVLSHLWISKKQKAVERHTKVTMCMVLLSTQISLEITMFDFHDYTIALFAGSQNAVRVGLGRYVGVGFFLEDGRIATCAHVVNLVQPDENLYGMDMKTGTYSEVHDIKQHAKYDFATGEFGTDRTVYFYKLEPKKFRIRQDVHTFGWTVHDKVDGTKQLDARFFKGYIVRTSDKPLRDDTRSTMEISFAAHSGFSGAPLLCPETGLLVGMLVANSESRIELHSMVEVNDDGKEYKETANRIVELGIAHSNLDIIEFLKEMS